MSPFLSVSSAICIEIARLAICASTCVEKYILTVFWASS